MWNILDNIREKLPGTKEFTELHNSQQEALDVMHMWFEGELVHSQIRNRINKNRDIYLGKVSQQYNQTQVEGELRIPTNMIGTVIDLMVFLLSNNMPSVQVTPNTTDKLGQLEASVAEDLIAKALRDSKFHRKYRNSVWTFLMGGFIWWYPFWNMEKEFGSKKNIFDFTLLNSLTTRVFYEDTDYERVPNFITTKRITPQAIMDMYGIAVLPDQENPFLQREISGEGIEDGKVTVFKKYDNVNITTVISNRVVEKVAHKLDFTPLIQINNKFVVNEAVGYDEVFRMLPVGQELNMLISAASEIARDLAWPVLIEHNNALAGRKLPKMRGNKIPVRRSDKGEGLEYLINPAQIGPILQQIELLVELFHFVSLMPKAAAGVFDSSVTSGFQARIAMQPATLNTENKRIDLEEGILRLSKVALYMVELNDPKALQIDENTKLVGLHELGMKVVWPDNLPTDIAREIQNLILGIQNSLTSVTQAVDKYNVMMGMGSSEETFQYLQAESKDAGLAPERALKVAQVQQTLAQIDQSLADMRVKLQGGQGSAIPQDLLPGGNDTNAARSMSNPDEAKQAPDTAREAVTPESTGGTVLPAGGGI